MEQAFQHLLVVQQHDDALALQRAITLAEQHQSRITVFKSFYKNLPPAMAGRSATAQQLEQFVRQQQQQIQQQVDTLSKHNLALNVVISWQHNERQALQQLTQQSDISMIIATQQHRHGVMALLPDRFEHYLINDCDLPVWLVKQHKAAADMQILACVDVDSELSSNAQLNDKILDIGNQLCQHQADKLQVINCYCNDDLTMSLPYDSAQGFAPLPDASGQHSARLQPYLTQHQLEQTQLYLSEGLVDDEIPKAAKQLKSDVAIIGNNHMHSLSSALLGDTAHYLTAHTPCDVLIVKPALSAQLALATP